MKYIGIGYKIQLFWKDTHNGSFVDISSIVGAPIVGNVVGNVLLLSGNLAKGVYDIELVLADGTTANIATYEVV